MLLTVPEACQTLKIGRTRLYEILANGEIKARKSGKKTLIEKSELERWVSTLPNYRKGA
ncbi:helix-turn-helix domain-containing protein [Micavibrio aeruginosavorus]|uniref:DNA binding, excisionase family domain protein n=1 Tax=Micavibrio aeruginosavorus (strain ARL-13) TaxID=856793 RepID=G2KNW0_MICAA|nr:helix-turn-helix domain-containing protein [Micavibrio aeruginosavorus]AEP10755.1 DNA binding, excisionase family domain protein [Micavibrio aeruginosavorus ARL-13]